MNVCEVKTENSNKISEQKVSPKIKKKLKDKVDTM